MTDKQILEGLRLDKIDEDIKQVKQRLKELKKQGYSIKTVRKEMRLFDKDMNLLDKTFSWAGYDGYRQFISYIDKREA